MNPTKYSDQFMDWLVEDGYTHCFFVGGGNVMHMLESARTRFECIAAVHEVSAGIAAEYFNASNSEGKRAFALVTAGPGLTNIVTAIGGAWLESRELLVVGGQAKVSDLAHGRVRQIGHQEIAGSEVVKPITVFSALATRRLEKYEVLQATHRSRTGRKGPVFLEICLDVSAMPALPEPVRHVSRVAANPVARKTELAEVLRKLHEAKRPLILIGGGIDNTSSLESLNKIKRAGIPIGSTWNGFDRVSFDYEFYAGRPNTYGMRWANIAIQQSDYIIALGTRLGIQQVGFASHHFAPLAEVVQVDLDANELNKGFPRISTPICADANDFLESLSKGIVADQIRIQDWQEFIVHLRAGLNGPDKANVAKDGYVELHRFISDVSKILTKDDLIACCSSGGTFNAVMQVFENKDGQKVLSNKGSASMGYGLAGAIGMAFANPDSRVVLFEGDGGFAQNLQELGTVSVNKLNIKMFISSNKGYASIRTTQKSYFDGAYLGCDESTGLGLPDWHKLFEAFGIQTFSIRKQDFESKDFLNILNSPLSAAFIIELDPEQLYFPKLTSRILETGIMETNPLHLMSPALTEAEEVDYLRYLPADLRS